MLTTDAIPAPAPWAKHVRYLDAFGGLVAVHDVTDISERAIASGRSGPMATHRWAKANYPDDATSYAEYCFWPCDEKWVVTTRHNRLQEQLAVAARRDPEEAEQARRFARMMQGRDKL